MKKYEFYWPEDTPKWVKIVLPIVVSTQVVVVIIGIIVTIVHMKA